MFRYIFEVPLVPLSSLGIRDMFCNHPTTIINTDDSIFGMSGPHCAIWFGILVVKMAEFCLITPPIGLNCFVVAGVRKDLSVQDVFKGVMPFFIATGAAYWTRLVERELPQ